MNSSGDPGRDAEAERVGQVYADYRRSRRRRRAWAAENPGNRAMRAELLEAVMEEAGPDLRSGGYVLDVGCGTGYWLEALRHAGVEPGRLTGVDVLPERVAAAAARVPGVTVQQADARTLPFEDGRFAVALLFTVLSSLGKAEHVGRALGEARRVLRPQGLLLVYELRLPNPLNPRVRRFRDSDISMMEVQSRSARSLTLLPPLARRLGTRTEALYPRLARLPPLRSHRLIVYRSL